MLQSGIIVLTCHYSNTLIFNSNAHIYFISSMKSFIIGEKRGRFTHESASAHVFSRGLLPRNISQAAKKLYVSPQSVSQTIIGLEKELDQKLFDRSGKKMVPTKTAVRLSTHAERILEEYQYILSNNFPNSEERRTVVMACCYDAPQSLGIEFYHRLQVEHPDIVFRLEEMPDPDA